MTRTEGGHRNTELLRHRLHVRVTLRPRWLILQPCRCLSIHLPYKVNNLLKILSTLTGSHDCYLSTVTGDMTLTCFPFQHSQLCSLEVGPFPIRPSPTSPKMTAKSQDGYQASRVSSLESHGVVSPNDCLIQGTYLSRNQSLWLGQSKTGRLILVHDEALSRLGEGPQGHTGCKQRRDALLMSGIVVGKG